MTAKRVATQFPSRLSKASLTIDSKAFQYSSRRLKASKTSQAPRTAVEVAPSVAGSKSLISRIWSNYTSALHTHPLRTKMTTAALIFFSSDSVTQYIMDKEEVWDSSRAASGAAFGVVATGYLHFWWGFLEATINGIIPAARSRLANTAVKVLIDQGVGAPLYIFTYYVMTNTIQRFVAVKETLNFRQAASIVQETEERARHMLWPTMMQHWKLWPLVHSVNFYFVPLQHRVLVQNTVLVGWSGYLSHLNKTGVGQNDGKLITPKEEVERTIERRRTIKTVA